MILKLETIEEYADFINEISNDQEYSDPHFTYCKDNLYDALSKKNNYVYASIKDNKINGLFVWLVLEDEKYIEMIIGLTKDKEAMSDMLEFMEKKYAGYQADFVINPQHTVIRNILIEKNASFETEQQYMLHDGEVPDAPEVCIEEYSEKWKDQYCNIHINDIYWTAEKVIAATERIRTFVAIEEQQLVGYLDVTYCYEENEPYSMKVKPEVENKGYELALLVNALKKNKPNRMMVLVDVDAFDEIKIYEAAGFKKVEGQNSVYATYIF